MNGDRANNHFELPVAMLGQSGCRFAFPDGMVYVDPYLSNSVQRLDTADLDRLVPIPFAPEEVADAAWVLITHEHIDHCDPDTLPAIARSSPRVRFMGPAPVLDLMRGWGIAADRLHRADECWRALGPDLKVHAISAAHPTHETDKNGCPRFVGYLLDWRGKRIYLAGDTSVTQRLIDCLKKLQPIHSAFLPVNEQNFFRARRGIIGNMSVREAFQLADEVGIQTVVPVHWDMFAPNRTAPAEMEAVYRQMQPRFQLVMQPDRLAF